MKRSFFLATGCILALPFAVPGQRPVRTISPPPSGPSIPGNTNNPNSNPSASSPNTGLPSGSSQSQIYVTGKVMVEDGGELPANVVIQKICGSQRQSLGYADPKGNFSVKVTGQSTASLLDASDDTVNRTSLPGQRQIGTSPLNGCEVQASSAGYRSEAINIGTQRALDNPNIGVIIIKRLAGNASGNFISETMRTAPKNAVKAYEHGLEAIRKGKSEVAEKDFEKAVELHPQFANAWYQLGHMQINTDPKLAQADFEKALSFDAKFMPPYQELALLSYTGHRWQETIDITDRALRLDGSSFPQLYYFNGVANFNLRHMPEAEKRAREAIKADVDHTVPRSYQLLSYVLAGKGDYAGAAEQMRVYIASAPNADEAARGRKDLAKLESKINEMANR